MKKILLIENEEKISRSIKMGLEEYHFSVEVAHNGVDGVQQACHDSFDIIIIESDLHDISVEEIKTALRRSHRVTPILCLAPKYAMLTQDEQHSAVVNYLEKPFHFTELIDRVNFLTRSKEGRNSEMVLITKNFCLNISKRILVCDSKKISLTLKECALLEYLIKNRERMIKHEELARQIWKLEPAGNTGMIDAYMNYLQMRIDKEFQKKLICKIADEGFYFED